MKVLNANLKQDSLKTRNELAVCEKVYFWLNSTADTLIQFHGRVMKGKDSRPMAALISRIPVTVNWIRERSKAKPALFLQYHTQKHGHTKQEPFLKRTRGQSKENTKTEAII